jgi:hypothetical protein
MTHMTVMTILCTRSNGIPLILQLAILSLPLPTSTLSCLNALFVGGALWL